MNYEGAQETQSGRLPPGKFFRELDWQVFNDAIVPSWLTSSGVVSLSSVATTVGSVNLTTTATVNTAVVVEVAFDIKLERFAAVDFIVDGLTFDTDDRAKIGFSLGIDDWTGNEGMRFYQEPADVSVTSRMHNVGGDVLKVMNYRFIGDGNGTNMKSVGIRVIPGNAGGQLLENGEVMGGHFAPATWVTSGAVKPHLSLVTREAVAHTMSFSRLRLRLWS